jgi:hypothetical protein
MSTRAPRTARPTHLSLVPITADAQEDPLPHAEDAVRPRARAVADLPEQAAAFRRETLAWALATARPADADALSAIIACKTEMDGDMDRFTEADVFELLWHGVVNWCTVRGTAVPGSVAETLWTLLDRLAALDRFTEDSDSLARLRRPLLTGGGLGPDGTARLTEGTRRRHPSGRRSDAG